MKNLGKLALLGAALAVSASSAFATSISAGMQNVAIGSISSTSYTTGTLVGTSSGTFVAPGIDYVATYTESVYKGGTGATCPSCLDFAFTVTDVSGSSLESTSIFNFAGFTSNVFYVGGTGPAITTANDNLSGTTIQFLLTNLAPGQSSSFVDFTNALSFTTGNISSQNGIAGNSPDLAPANTPEPNSLMLLGTGLVSAAGMMFRRRVAA